jgi:hypothetical protein
MVGDMIIDHTQGIASIIISKIDGDHIFYKSYYDPQYVAFLFGRDSRLYHLSYHQSSETLEIITKC